MLLIHQPMNASSSCNLRDVDPRLIMLVGIMLATVGILAVYEGAGPLLLIGTLIYLWGNFRWDKEEEKEREQERLEAYRRKNEQINARNAELRQLQQEKNKQAIQQEKERQESLLSRSTNRSPRRPRKREKEKRRLAQISRGATRVRSEATGHWRTPQDYEKQFRRWQLCPYCSKTLPTELDDSVELDHIYPISSGGQNLGHNLVFVRRSCNQTKSNDGLVEFCQKTGKDIAAVADVLNKLNKKV